MFKLSQEGEAYVKNELTRYETKRSAILPALYRVQKENDGWISKESITYLAGLMELPEAWINEVFHFYTMYNKKPVGKLHVQVCCNLSCSINGGRELAEDLAKTFGVGFEELSKDGNVTVSKVECLGSCDTGPMMQVNDNYYENLTSESAIKLLKDMANGNQVTN